jgi:hypothetical protein
MRLAGPSQELLVQLLTALKTPRLPRPLLRFSIALWPLRRCQGCPIVVPEFEFRNIERQILVIGPNDAALDERPETLNRVGVDRADDMLANGVINGLMGKRCLRRL